MWSTLEDAQDAQDDGTDYHYDCMRDLDRRRTVNRAVPLRVLVVHNRYRSSQPSGEDRVVDEELALLNNAGHHATLFGRESDDIAGMTLPTRAALPFQVTWNSGVRAELARHLAADRPDVVHIHSTFPLLSPSVLAACSDAGVRVVATLHNYAQVCPSGTLFRNGRVCVDCTRGLPLASLRHGCYRNSTVATAPLTVSLVMNRARWHSDVTRFLCVSRAQRDILVNFGMPAEKMAVKYNFVPEPRARRSGLGDYILFLGRLTEEKGLRDLMAAWDRVSTRTTLPVPLVLAGAGPMEREVAEWAGSRSNVAFLGLRTRADCEELTAKAVAVIAPSRWMEPLGTVVISAMAAGVPTVAPAHGSFIELAQDGETGVLYKPGDVAELADAIERVTTDVEENLRMGKDARRYYEQAFTREIGLAALVAAYRSVIAGERVPAQAAT
jgi:glycosyltransferase involved in cell wall biosynthesis